MSDDTVKNIIAEFEHEFSYLIAHKGESRNKLSEWLSTEEISALRLYEALCSSLSRLESGEGREAQYRKALSVIAEIIPPSNPIAREIWNQCNRIARQALADTAPIESGEHGEWDSLTKKEMWDTIQEIRELTKNDGTMSPVDSVRALVESRIESGDDLRAEIVRLVAKNDEMHKNELRLIDENYRMKTRLESGETHDKIVANLMEMNAANKRIIDQLEKELADYREAFGEDGDSLESGEGREAVLAKIDKAWDEVSELCKGKRWTMHIPAQPDSDSDLVISDALYAARQALAAPVPQGERSCEHEWMRPSSNSHKLEYCAKCYTARTPRQSEGRED